MFLQELLRFTAVGAIGASVDRAIFNVLASTQCRWRRIPASIASTTCAMFWRFSANWFWVFQRIGAAAGVRFVRFLLVTCFSGWVLQTWVIRATNGLLAPGRMRLSNSLSRRIPLRHLDFLERNLTKDAAIGFGYVWNFCWYRNWVYAGPGNS